MTWSKPALAPWDGKMAWPGRSSMVTQMPFLYTWPDKHKIKRWKDPPFYSWVNQLFLWPCSIAMLNCPRVNQPFSLVIHKTWSSVGPALHTGDDQVVQASIQSGSVVLPATGTASPTNRDTLLTPKQIQELNPEVFFLSYELWSV